MLEEVIGRGGLEVGIQVGIRTRVLNCVTSERLMKALSTENTVTPRQGVHKIFHFSDTILRESTVAILGSGERGFKQAFISYANTSAGLRNQSRMCRQHIQFVGEFHAIVVGDYSGPSANFS